MNTYPDHPRFDPDGETRPILPEDDSLAQTRPQLPGAFENPEPRRQAPPAPPARTDSMGQFQPIRVPRQAPPPPQRPPTPPPVWGRPPRRRRSLNLGCMTCAMPVVLGLLALVLVYLLFPLRTNLLVMGIDRVPDGTAMGRTDTIILMSVIPLRPDVNMLSIPRDLWVDVPGVGPNRINTAHFFAEGERQGSGPEALRRTVQTNFGVRVPYHVRIRFDGFTGVVEAMGGLNIELSEPMSGYDAGVHRLNGDQALAFARDRAGTDDFFRMARGQMVIKAMLRQLAKPASWPRLPLVAVAGMQAVDTNLPVWHWPRIGLALLRAGPDGIENRTISREMVLPFTTDGGAQVLAPNWDLIRPLVREMFGST